MESFDTEVVIVYAGTNPNTGQGASWQGFVDRQEASMGAVSITVWFPEGIPHTLRQLGNARFDLYAPAARLGPGLGGQDVSVMDRWDDQNHTALFS